MGDAKLMNEENSDDELDVDALIKSFESYPIQEIFPVASVPPAPKELEIESKVDNSPKICTLCGILCANRSRLEFHKTLRHNIQKFYECDICHEKFETDLYLKLHKKKEDVHQFLFCPNCRLTLQNEEVVLKHKQFHKDFPNSAYVNQGYTEQTKISHSTINKVFNPNLIQKVKKNPEKLSLAAKRLVKVTLKGQDTKAEDVLIKNHNGILAVSKYSKESWSATEINIELLDRRFGNNKFLINETFDPLDESLKQLHELERMRIRKFGPPKQTMADAVKEEVDDFTVPCGICQQYFPNVLTMKRHQNKKHHSGPYFYCLQCRRKFRTEASLKTHQRMHFGCKSVIKCTYCNEDFTSMSLLRLHQQNERATELKAKTDVVANETQNVKVESNVSSATTSRSSSPEQKELVIDDWVNTSKSEFVLMDGEGVRDLGLQISHVSGGGSMIKEFSTEIGKEFSKDPLPMPSSSEDQEPQENNPSTSITSTGASPYFLYKCEICFKKYRHKASVKLHMRQVHFKIRYDCSSCNEKFARIPYLKAHQIEAHPNVIFDNYQCTDCDKRFKSNYSLHVHSRSHFSTGWNTKRPIYGFPCTCDKCGMIITKRKDLTAHMYRHRIKERNDEKIKQQIDLANKAALMQLQKPKYKQEYLAKKGNPKPKVKTTPDKMVNSVESKNSYGSDHSEDCIMIQEKAECITVADSDEEQGAAVFF